MRISLPLNERYPHAEVSWPSLLWGFFFYVYSFLRDRAWGGEGQREREAQNPKQAPSCQHRAWCGTWTHELWDHDLRWSQSLNWLSHPGGPCLPPLMPSHSSLDKVQNSDWLLPSKAFMVSASWCSHLPLFSLNCHISGIPLFSMEIPSCLKVLTNTISFYLIMSFSFHLTNFRLPFQPQLKCDFFREKSSFTTPNWSIHTIIYFHDSVIFLHQMQLNNYLHISSMYIPPA